MTDIEAENVKLEAAFKRYPMIMSDGLTRYILRGVRCGSFLTAVLENDLKGAVSRADLGNRVVLHEYVAFLYNHAPNGCWGSPENVMVWQDQGGLAGRA